MPPLSFTSRRSFTFGLAGLAASLMLPTPRPSRASPLPGPKYPIARRFDAFWNGNAIGSHEFSVTPTGGPGDCDVAVEIDIRVDLGWLGEVSYRHTSREAWRSGRVITLESWTDDDGEVFAVTGAAAGDYFRMDGPGGPFEASGALLTSNSIWSERICEESEIIDATAGTVIGLVASPGGTAYAMASGDVQLARIYQVISPIIAGTFWYDEAGIWMRGQLVRSGVKIDYVLPA